MPNSVLILMNRRKLRIRSKIKKVKSKVLLMFVKLKNLCLIGKIMKRNLKGDLSPKRHPGFYGTFFFNVMKENLCTKFCGILISFHEVIKLPSFEFGVNDVIPANVQNIFTAGFLCIELCTKFYGVLEHFTRNCEIATF